MSFNGAGSFVINSAGMPVVATTLITAAAQNALTADLATGLSTAILKDGQQTVTANIPFGGFKLTGVGAATARTDAATLAGIQDGTGVYVGTVGGTADAITLTPSPSITAYAAGQTFRFIASGANTTAVTVAVSGLTAKALTKNGAVALIASDILTGSMVVATFDGTRFILGASANNANLTGHVTSVGNAAVLGSFTVAQLSTAISDANISGTNTGDQTSIVGITGTIAQFNTAVTDADLAILGANTFTGLQTVKDTKDTVHTITDGAAFEIDPVNGNIQVVTLGASRSPLATNFAAGQSIILGVDDGTAFTVTWPSVTWLKVGGTGVAPTLAATGYTWVMLYKQGTTLFGANVGSP